MLKKFAKAASAFLLAASLAAPALSYGGTVLLSLDVVTDMEQTYNPNDVVQYELTVNNENGEAWLRCRFGFDSYNVDVEFSDEYMDMQDGWVLRGGYWYYTEKAESRASYLITDYFTVPDITWAGDGAWIYASAVVDAIDYDSCTPDFTSEDPWGETELAYSVSTAGTKVSESGSGSGSGSGSSSGGQTAADAGSTAQTTTVNGTTVTRHYGAETSPVAKLIAFYDNGAGLFGEGWIDRTSAWHPYPWIGRTGDYFPLVPLVAAALLCGAGVLAVTVIRGRKKNEKENGEGGEE